MPLLVALSHALPLWVVLLGGMALGSIVNWAIYRLAWNPREISPWGPRPAKAPPRKWSDRLPVIGWLGLRREHVIHGRGFWLRPLAVELGLGMGLAVLYWWEVEQLGLIAGQVNDLFGVPVALADGALTGSMLWPTFITHALLVAFMAAASFIDIDEKIIPDEVTLPGTMLGLVLATLLPLSFLPHVSKRNAPPEVGEVIQLPAVVAGLLNGNEQVYTEPVTLAAPNRWPVELQGAPNWKSLVVGQACWWLWCFALAPRIWRGRHGAIRAISLIARRVSRELTRPPLAVFAWPGSLAIAAIWWLGGAAWLGLLTALVGLAVSGGLVWIVRLVGTAALGREAMGFGDVTLMMMVGTYLGWQAGVLIFFVAPFAGLIVGIVQAVTQHNDVIPYGPFLCLGSVFVMVGWSDVWNRTQFAFQDGWLVPVVLLFCMSLLAAMLAGWQQVKRRLFRR